jgi:nucleotide-binding universal stress UspA family protein
MADKADVLVVANQTAESDQLLEALRERAERGPCRFHLLVPATPHGAKWATDMHAGGAEAEQHLQRAIQRYRDAGLEVDDGKVGDPDPVAAVQDALNFKEFDEVIVSTLHQRLSRWLKLDLPHKIEHSFGKPVTHVEAKV